MTAQQCFAMGEMSPWTPKSRSEAWGGCKCLGGVSGWGRRVGCEHLVGRGGSSVERAGGVDLDGWVANLRIIEVSDTDGERHSPQKATL